MEDQEHGEGEGRPEPAELHKVDVEDILLLRKVAGREFGRVRLRSCAVGCAARGGGEYAENGAEEEGQGVDGDEERLEARGEEGRARCGAPPCCCGTDVD